MSHVILAQLLALRAQLDATIALVEATVRPEPAPGSGGGCPHPPERQRNASTFGEPNQVVCLDCNWKRSGAVPA